MQSAWHHDLVFHGEPHYGPIPRAEIIASLKHYATACIVHMQLTREQLDALRRCANGISLRFEASAIVNALVAGGYVEKGVAGVVTVTAKGEEYLRTRAT